MSGLKGRFVCVWNCLNFFIGEYSSVWPEICRVLSQIQWRFLRGISGEKLFQDNFSETLCKPRSSSSTKTCEIFALLSAILFWVRIALKRFTHVPSYVFCTQVRRHIHKQITKRWYREEKPGHFVSRKSVLFVLGLRPTTPYSLRIFAWNFYQTFLIVPTEFWLRLGPQIHPTRFAINCSFINARAERKVRLYVKLYEFFPKWILIRLTWKLPGFFLNSVDILTWNFRKKLFWENF